MERREAIRMLVWMGLEEVVKGILAILFLTVLLFLVLFVHSWAGILLALLMLLGFILVTGKRE